MKVLMINLSNKLTGWQESPSTGKAAMVFSLLSLVVICLLSLTVVAQEPPEAEPAIPKSSKEATYYQIVDLPVPENILLEVGGLATMPDGRVALCTRRGDVWLIENPYMKNGRQPKFKLFASGLHEALGLAYRNNALYIAQRGELTRFNR